LGKKYKIFSPVMPGFGKTKINFPYNLDKYADWLKNFITKNRIINPIILGHSFGGSVCVKFLSKYPNKKTKLILVDAAIVKDKRSFIKKTFYFFFYIVKPIMELSGLIKFNKLNYQNINSPVMKKTFQNAVFCDLIKETSILNNKTLIIWGKRDAITPLTFGKKINKKMKNSTLKIIPNSGHYPFLDEPSLFVSHLDNFIIKT
jgi:pimeloyl-ACP methyl ester carboxylesterase